jgi:acyl-CoA synthetase (AMP-forming)/AMP-acid ligase II
MLRRTSTGWTLPDSGEEAQYRRAAGAGTDALVADAVRRRLAEDPARVAVVDGAGRLTRQELHERALRLGSALMRRGLGPGAVVAFQLPNWSEACVISLASALYGFVLCPLLPMYREHELGFILSQTLCDALFIPGVFRNVDYPALLARTRIAGTGPRVFGVRAGGPSPSLDDLLAEPGAIVAPPPVDPAAVKSIGFTSGTTGRPKGVLHSHRTAHATIHRAADFWGFDARDRLLVPSPIGHVGGSIYAFEFPWFSGTTAHLMEAWDPAQAVAQIEREGLTFCAGATPFLRGLLDSVNAAGSRLPSLRRFVCGGASVPAALVAEAADVFANAVVSRAYGSSEVPLVCPGVRSRADARHGQVTDGEVDVDLRLVDLEDRPVADGAEGDIVARSAGQLIGYLDSDDEAGAFTPDGFFRMGDLGRMVDGRYLEITGRRKELIIRLGENISPLEIETVLLQCDAIERVAVVGVPNARTGERAVAFVALRPGRALSFADMQAFLARAGLARQKFPEELHVLPALPMNAIGKVMKTELKRIAAGTPPNAGGTPPGTIP